MTVVHVHTFFGISLLCSIIVIYQTNIDQNNDRLLIFMLRYLDNETMNDNKE